MQGKPWLIKLWPQSAEDGITSPLLREIWGFCYSNCETTQHNTTASLCSRFLNMYLFIYGNIKHFFSGVGGINQISMNICQPPKSDPLYFRKWFTPIYNTGKGKIGSAYALSLPVPFLITPQRGREEEEGGRGSSERVRVPRDVIRPDLPFMISVLQALGARHSLHGRNVFLTSSMWMV